MTNSLLSVIIPTYKRNVDMLNTAIESILGQTYPSIELIVVSDNPPESEHARLVEDAVKRYDGVRFYQMPQNGGAQRARNAGIAMSAGEYLGFLDDDDLWMPEKAEKQIALFADENVGLTFSNGYCFFGDDLNNRNDYRVVSEFKIAPTLSDMLRFDYIGSTTNAIFRRKCVETCGEFDVSLKARQDYEMWLRIMSRFEARGLNEPLFFHRLHESDQITKHPDIAIESILYVREKYKGLFDQNSIALAKLYENVSRLYEGMNDRQNAKKYHRLSASTNLAACLKCRCAPGIKRLLRRIKT